MKIIDCFIFYNELELLTYRLNILNDVVDYFIIVESTHTFVGKEKILYFELNKHLFDFCKDKIIHVIVDDFPYKYPNCDISKTQQWDNERFQRNQIKRGLDNLSLNDDDVIIITDLDEIPDPNTLLKIKNNDIQITIQSLDMGLYYYNLNTIAYISWWEGKIMTYNIFKQLNLTCSEIRFYKCVRLPYCGWHLSYFGDSNYIRNKIINFSHQEYNNDIFTNIDFINQKINNNEYLFDNKPIKFISIQDNQYLPYKYDVFLTKYYKM
jgi:beta-1,4-mannosyl-glycoprotein beta-1,4-N-acetylglucosaminyltransferase